MPTTRCRPGAVTFACVYSFVATFPSVLSHAHTTILFQQHAPILLVCKHSCDMAKSVRVRVACSARRSLPRTHQCEGAVRLEDYDVLSSRIPM